MEQIVYLDKDRNETDKDTAAIKVIRELDDDGLLIREQWDYLLDETEIKKEE